MTWGDTQVIQLISILRRSVQSQCRIHEILVAAMPIDINKPGQIGSGILPNIQHQEPWVRSKFNDIWIYLGLLRIEEVFNIRMGLITSFDNQWGGVNFNSWLNWCQLRSIAAAFHAVQPGAMWNQLISWTCSKSFHVYADADRLAKGLGVLGMLVSLSNYIMGCCLHLFVESVCLHHSRNIELKHGTHPTLFPCQLMIVHDFSV